MKIGIDARLINETGVGRYIRNLIDELAQIDKKNRYVVFLRDGMWRPPNERWESRIADIPWHSIAEQVQLPILFTKERLDLLHIPYFTIPMFYPGKFIVTMHDLTLLHYPTGKATTLPLLFYWAKILAYRVILEVGLRRASHVIAVSEATKKELMDHFALDEGKISVIHEGVIAGKPSKRLIKEPYFLYVGNAYPHKNLETLISAVGARKLVLVGKEDLFYKRLKQNIISSNVTFFGEANDEQLASLYTYASALVFSSLMEGFGLPGLEAMAMGTPVVCSDIPVFHEIYGDAALYFDPKNVEDIVVKLDLIRDEALRKKLIQKGLLQVKKYSWEKMARQTFEIYK